MTKVGCSVRCYLFQPVALQQVLKLVTGMCCSYMESLLADAESAGAMLATNSQLVGGSVDGNWKLLDVKDTHTGEVTKLRSRWLVNAAGNF